MSKMKMAAATAAMVAMAGGEDILSMPRKVESKAVDIRPPVIPKGLREYFFDLRGDFSTERMKREDCVFICHALNDKNAIKKYRNWLNLI